MTNRDFISDDEVDRALDYLRDNADDAARARAERLYVEEYRKVVKAQLMKQHETKPAVIQERDACADPIYIAHLQAIREAVFADERHRFMREAAGAKIEAWRTASSNIRAMKI